MRRRLRLYNLWIPLVALGIFSGILANRLLPRQSPTSYAKGPIFGGCRVKRDASGKSVLQLEEVTEDRPPEQEARRLLGGYAQALCGLAIAASRFGSATIESIKDVRVAASPLSKAIKNVNDAYVSLSVARMPLSADLLTARHRKAAARSLVCEMKFSDDFQWRHLRTALNQVLVYVVPAWQGNADQFTLPKIKAQQKVEWPSLADALKAESRRSGFSCDLPQNVL